MSIVHPSIPTFPLSSCALTSKESLLVILIILGEVFSGWGRRKRSVKSALPLYCAIFARSLGRAYSITAGGCGDSLVFSLAPKAVLAKSSLWLLLTWLRISSLPLVFLLCSPRTTDGQRHLHFKSSRVLSCLATVATYARGEWEGGTDPHRFVPCLLFFYSYAMHGRFWYAEKNSLDLRGGRGGVGWWNYSDRQRRIVSSNLFSFPVLCCVSSLGVAKHGSCALCFPIMARAYCIVQCVACVNTSNSTVEPHRESAPWDITWLFL